MADSPTDWIIEMRRIAVAEFGFDEASAEQMRAEDYCDYFADGYSPREALKEDLSYA